MVGLVRNAIRFLVVFGVGGVVSWLAVEGVKVGVTDPKLRDWAIVVIVPLALVLMTVAFCVWIWKGDQSNGPPEPVGSAALEPPRSAGPHPTGRAPTISPARVFPISEPAPPTPPPYERLPDGRLVYNVTLQQLTGFFKDQTTAQGNRRVEAWIGKLMRFTGSVYNVNEHETWAMISLDPIPNAEGLVFASFNTPELISRVAVFVRGDRVGVIGRINQVQATSVHLEDCELVETFQS